MSKISITSPVVSVSWLNDHLDAENLVVLDGSIKKIVNPKIDSIEFQIPKTRFFDLKTAFSNESAPFPTTFPSEEKFTLEAQALGINKNSAIVVYDDKGIYSSARVWWMFKAMGHDNVAVLNGGLPEWIKAGYITEGKSYFTGVKGDFEAHYKLGFMKFYDDVKQASETKTHTIIDARSEGRFKSIEPEPRVGLRMGTIPNSVNFPFEDLLKNNQLLSKKVIEAKFQSIAKKEEPIIFSCGSGITACILALGATISGYENIAVYDGSWTEWGSLVSE
ncbi:sulfurtransferase [Mariniflexile gromovii]|uniref:Sulfurtransferase n=1 Tax=Mariniflexile gromovii TaxID=362523 RepID=A0ABS4BXP5_9FLAO|nr:sulfurtransferase [Mariniflexile gromovii]MBP0905349.1 sulfurtransferase [Mariniflexile gromovii]